MKQIKKFKILSTKHLAETEKILKESNLVVDDLISKIVLMGSRGLLGGFRPDSDFDLGLLLRSEIETNDNTCIKANELTLSKWSGVK